MPLQMKRRGKSSPQPKRSLKNRIPSKSVRIGEMYWQNPSTFIGRLTAAIVKKISGMEATMPVPARQSESSGLTVGRK